MAAETVLNATDAEDLDVLSARFQDALVRVTDMGFRPGERRFALMTNRFMWETAKKGWFRTKAQRVRAALHFNGVLDVKSLNLPKPESEAVLPLLAIRAEPVDPADADNPERYVTLIFSGDAAIRLHVECLDAEARDLGEPWDTRHSPDHG